MIKIDSLTPVPYNPRTIDPESLERLAGLIKTHTVAVSDNGGMYRLASSITINRNGMRIVGGNQRVQALMMLEQENVHPDDVTWVAVEPDSDEEKSLCLALNARDAQGSFDWEGVAALLEEFKCEPADLGVLTGFAPHTYEPLLAADWSPPEPSGNKERLGIKPPPISLTRDERAVVDQALAKFREVAEDELSDGAAVAAICREYVEAE